MPERAQVEQGSVTGQNNGHWLLACLRGRLRPHPLGELSMHLLASHLEGNTALPSYLGLYRIEYNQWLSQHFRPAPGIQLIENLARAAGSLDSVQRSHWRAKVRHELLLGRKEEFESLYQLLLNSIAGQDPAYEAQWAKIVAAGCLGSRHLWQDLGLRSREDLSSLLSYVFPELVRANDQDMRWKRFFYRRLCEEGGDYVCRSPSCEDCSSYSLCFVGHENSHGQLEHVEQEPASLRGVKG